MIEKYIKTAKERTLYDFIFENDLELKNEIVQITKFDNDVINSHKKFIDKGYRPEEIRIDLTCNFKKGTVDSSKTYVSYSLYATVNNGLHTESFSMNSGFKIVNIDFTKVRNEKGLSLLKSWSL